MTFDRRQPQIHAFSAVLTLAALLALIWYAMIAPFEAWRASEKTQGAQLNQRMTGLSETIRQMTAELEVEQRSLGEGIIWSGKSRPLVLASMQRDIQRYASSAKVGVRSIRQLPIENVGSGIQLGFNVEANTTMAGLLEFVHTLANSRPALGVSSGTILQTSSTAVFEPAEPILRLRLDVVGVSKVE